jgi:cyclophilin family peptidyl-prolyl cis-trans isomerase
MIKKACYLLTILALSSCRIFGPTNGKTSKLFVDSTKKDCLQVKYTEKETEWSSLCQPINGFDYEVGYTYALEVVKIKIAKSKKTETSGEYRYTLSRVIRKTPNLTENGIYAYIQTNHGDIVGKLEMDKAPLTTANFVGLAEGSLTNSSRAQGVPYYDSLIFHRIIPNFMIQGGDPTGTGSGGPGYKFKNEIHPSLKHNKPGVFSMANSGPNTNGSQFFITHKATPWLDGGYNIFGQVVLGQKYITLMGGLPRGRGDRPNEPVVMSKVTIIRIGDAAKAFNANDTFQRLK